MHNEKEEKLLKKAYFFLKFRPRTEKEIRDYLIKRTKPPASLVDLVIKKLKAQGFINDEKFIEWFINQRISFKPKSKNFLKQELLHFGINHNLIEDFLNKASLNEEELAFEALRRKKNQFEKLPKREKYEKAISFLVRRGFNFEISKKVFNKVFNL